MFIIGAALPVATFINMQVRQKGHITPQELARTLDLRCTRSFSPIFTTHGTNFGQLKRNFDSSAKPNAAMQDDCMECLLEGIAFTKAIISAYAHHDHVSRIRGQTGRTDRRKRRTICVGINTPHTVLSV